MNIKQNLYITKFLFFISIILSIGTFFNQKNGGSEIYPFYHWKLFSQPLGNYYTFDSYRIYGITTNNDTVRIPNIWEISTLIIFFVQLFAVFNKKISYFILIGLVTFHIYTILFLNIFFYTSVFVLIILLLPYHLIFKKRFEKFNLK
jgi:hypothetical protein